MSTPTKANLPRIAFHDSMILLSGIVLFGLVSFFGGGGYTSLISQSNVWRTTWRARALARHAFEMSRLSQPPKWEVRPYGCFFAADAAGLSDCRRESEPFQFFVFFFCGDEKNKQTKNKTLSNSRHIVSRSHWLTLPSWTFRRHLAD